MGLEVSYHQAAEAPVARFTQSWVQITTSLPNGEESGTCLPGMTIFQLALGQPQAQSYLWLRTVNMPVTLVGP